MKKVKCIVPVSGGKDSQACLKLAVQEFGAEHVLGLFCDTQFEHPLTYQHIENLKTLYGVDIVSITAGSVEEQIQLRKRFPSAMSRFCTSNLKTRAGKRFYKKYAETHGPVEVWYGMRTDESAARAKRYAYRDPDVLFPPHEMMGEYPQYLGKMGVMFRVPVVDWTTEEIFELLDGEENPLYAQGFNRVGCFPCLASGDAAKIKAFTHDETGARHLAMIRRMEALLGKSVFTAKIGQRFNEEQRISVQEIDAEYQADNNHGCRICEI